MESDSVEPIELEEVGDREMLAVSAGSGSPNAATALPIARVSHRPNKFDIFRFDTIRIDILF
jgi:hypothetical protein